MLQTILRRSIRPTIARRGMSSVSEQVKSLIEKNDKTLMFSKTTCPFCNRLAAVFNDMDLSYDVVQLNMLDEGVAMQRELLKITGQSTVPNVFVKGTHVGGHDDVVALIKSGEFQKML